MTGYGRGYYGEDQLAKAPRRRGGGWIKIALVLGVGAVVWLMWPRKTTGVVREGLAPSPGPMPPGGQLAQLPAQQLPAQQFSQQQLAPQQPLPILPQQALGQIAQPQALPALPPPTLPPEQSPQHGQLAQLAQSNGYPSSKEYEDAVVASAKQLQASGAKVMLAPHLAHLTPRLGS